MELKISVNTNHIMTHLTLEDLTLTCKKFMTLLSVSLQFPLMLHTIC